MARKNKEGKYIPVIKNVEMTEIINGKWKTVKCNTLEEAEKLENNYCEFWNT